MSDNDRRNSRLREGQYFGQAVKKIRLHDLVLTEKIHAPGVRLPRHSHENAYFCTVLRGGWHETVGSRERQCKPMGTQFHPSDEVHSDHFDRGRAHAFNIELGPAWIDRFRDASIRLDQPRELDSEVTALTLRVFEEFGSYDRFSPVVIEGLVLELGALSARRQSSLPATCSPRWLKGAREMIRELCGESLSLERIAETAGVHPVYLARTFRRLYGTTVGDYQRRCRVQRACRELAETEKSLVDIALSCGFYDQSHFTRTFKKVTGMTPAKYRSLLIRP